MALYIIGLGLHDEKDITLKGLEILRRCNHVYLEYYTSKLSCTVDELRKFYGKNVIIADREMIETGIEEEIFSKAREGDVALLVIGDPFGATTHIDIRIRAQQFGIEVKVIHNASVMTAVGMVGLELYKFGKTTSIPFDNANVTSPIEAFNNNRKLGLHTLFLLDLDPLSERFMTINEAASYLLSKGVSDNESAVGCAGLGSDSPEIKAGKLSVIQKEDFSLFPQCLIIPGKLHFIEEDALKLWM